MTLGFQHRLLGFANRIANLRLRLRRVRVKTALGKTRHRGVWLPIRLHWRTAQRLSFATGLKSWRVQRQWSAEIQLHFGTRLNERPASGKTPRETIERVVRTLPAYISSSKPFGSKSSATAPAHVRDTRSTQKAITADVPKQQMFIWEPKRRTRSLTEWRSYRSVLLDGVRPNRHANSPTKTRSLGVIKAARTSLALIWKASTDDHPAGSGRRFASPKSLSKTSNEPRIDDVARHRSLTLVWRETKIASTVSDDSVRHVSPSITSTPTYPDRAGADLRMREEHRWKAAESALVDRVAHDVVGRIEKRMRIERERRGI